MRITFECTKFFIQFKLGTSELILNEKFISGTVTSQHFLNKRNIYTAITIEIKITQSSMICHIESGYIENIRY